MDGLSADHGWPLVSRYLTLTGQRRLTGRNAFRNVSRMPLQSFVTIRGRVPRTASIILGSLPIVAIFLLWWLFTLGPPEERRIAPTILPNPVEVAQSIPELVTGRDLPHHVWASVRRVSVSFILSLIIVLPLGILMGSFGSVGA